MLASLRAYWEARERYQSFLDGVGGMLLPSGSWDAEVFVVAGGAWDGPVSWRKPILFGLSFGVTALLIAWVASFLPKRRGSAARSLPTASPRPPATPCDRGHRRSASAR